MWSQLAQDLLQALFHISGPAKRGTASRRLGALTADVGASLPRGSLILSVNNKKKTKLTAGGSSTSLLLNDGKKKNCNGD